jgi:hypothetical protein
LATLRIVLEQDFTENMTTSFPGDLSHIILPFVVDKHSRKQELVIR